MKKWILRLLTLMIVLGAFMLFALKIISGPGEQQKKGLEQAFSQIFQGTASFGKLVTFNLFPQFTVDIENLAIEGAMRTGQMKADKVLIAFGPIDLILKNRTIENFNVKNAYAGKDVFTPLDISLTDAGIYPDKDGTGQFTFTGTYGSQPINGRVGMGMKSGLRPKYFLNDLNSFALNIGSVQLSGQFAPYSEGGGQVSQLEFFATGKNGRQDCKLASDKIIPVKDFFKSVVGPLSDIKNAMAFRSICDDLKQQSVQK